MSTTSNTIEFAAVPTYPPAEINNNNNIIINPNPITTKTTTESTIPAIPDSSNMSNLNDPSSSFDPVVLLSSLKHQYTTGRLSAHLSSQLRPLPSFIDAKRWARPRTPTEAWTRLEINTHYYWLNYCIILLLILCIAIISKPVFLVTILVLIALWYATLTHEVIVIPGVQYSLQGKVKLYTLYAITVVLLLFFAGNTILLCVGLGCVIVVVHAVFRTSPSLEEREAQDGMVQMAVV